MNTKAEIQTVVDEVFQAVDRLPLTFPIPIHRLEEKFVDTLNTVGRTRLGCFHWAFKDEYSSTRLWKQYRNNLGDRVKRVHLCKHCGEVANANCCLKYKAKDRMRKYVVYDTI